MTADEAALLAEANRINYRLRSTFFYRKLKEYDTLSLPALVAELLPVEYLYSWDDRQQWGIGEDAFNYISSHAEPHLFQVFCHPKLLREHPRLLAYYRNIAALSQKAVSYLVGINVKGVEADINNRILLTSDQSFALARLFNEHVTLIVDASIRSLTEKALYGILLTSTGAQIDGSWRNAIGQEAVKVVQRLLVNEARDRDLLAALIPRAEPAGALERYGAAKKTFEEARRLNPHVPTILIASCITPEVHTRIRQDPLITSYYNLTELLSRESEVNDKFMRQVFALLGAAGKGSAS